MQILNLAGATVLLSRRTETSRIIEVTRVPSIQNLLMSQLKKMLRLFRKPNRRNEVTRFAFSHMGWETQERVPLELNAIPGIRLSCTHLGSQSNSFPEFLITR